MRCGVDGLVSERDGLVVVECMSGRNREAEGRTADGKDESKRDREAEVVARHDRPLIARHFGRGSETRLHIGVLIENCGVDGIEVDGLYAGKVLLLRD